MWLRNSRIPFVLVVLAIAGCEQPLSTETQLMNSASMQLDRSPARPFRFKLTGNANPDFSQGPCNVTNIESGTGVAQHLGRVTWSSSEVANFCVDPANSALGSVTGSLVITAANGDQLSATYTTTVNADFAAGQLTARGNYTITGGTGRLSGASGSGILDVTGSLAPPFKVAGIFSGVIGY